VETLMPGLRNRFDCRRQTLGFYHMAVVSKKDNPILSSSFDKAITGTRL
jgi:hypothetical protein